MAHIEAGMINRAILLALMFGPLLGPVAVLLAAAVSWKRRPVLRQGMVEDPHPMVQAWGTPDRAEWARSLWRAEELWFPVSRRLLPSRWLRNARVLPLLVAGALYGWLGALFLRVAPPVGEVPFPLAWLVWLAGAYLAGAVTALIGDGCVLAWRVFHPPSYIATEEGLYLFDTPLEGEPGGEYVRWTQLRGWSYHPLGFVLYRSSLPPVWMEPDEIPPQYEQLFVWASEALRPRVQRLLESCVGEKQLKDGGSPGGRGLT